MTRSTEKLRTEAVTHVEIMLDHASRDVSGQLVIDALCVRLYAGLEVLSRIDPASRVLTGGELECTEGVRFGCVGPDDSAVGSEGELDPGDLLVQPTAVTNSDEAMMLVEGHRAFVHGVDHDQSPADGLRRGGDRDQGVQQQLPTDSLTLQAAVHGELRDQVATHDTQTTSGRAGQVVRAGASQSHSPEPWADVLPGAALQ